MTIVKPSATLIKPTRPSLDPYEKIELCGRTCYKSEDKIAPGTSVKFVKNMLKNRHLAMLEHGQIHLKTEPDVGKYFETCKYIIVSYTNGQAYISGSFRAFLELFETYTEFVDYFPSDQANAVFNALCDVYYDVFGKPNFLKSKYDVKVILTDEAFKYAVRQDAPIDSDTIIRKHITHTIKFVCDRGVSHEFVRHRPASFAQESTRYCNYSKDKFGNEIAVIAPFFFKYDSPQWHTWLNSCENAEKAYFELLEQGATPQEARSVLPNSLKTEILITATENEWQHIINLRYHGTTGKPHPQMVEVMTPAREILIEASENRIS